MKRIMEKEENKTNSTSGDFINPKMEEKILRRVSEYKAPFLLTKEEAFIRLNQKIEGNQSKTINPASNNKLRLFYRISAVAATLLVLFVVGKIWFFGHKTTISAPRGTQMEYSLSDGTQVFLNADSKISFQEKRFKEHRNIFLDGEAFFQVTKGTTFTIKTSYASIRVLGTSFNVFARKENFKVSCLTGKVQVLKNNEKVTLIPGESAELNQIKLVKFIDKNYRSSDDWRNGEFNYLNTPLETIFDELGRQFNVTFTGENLSGKYFTGSFTNKNLTDALDIVCIPMGLNYEVGNDRKVYIKNSVN